MLSRTFAFFIALAILATSTSLSAQTWDVSLEKGKQAESRGDLPTALTHYLAAARLGAPVGMNAAGNVYLIQRDYSRAFMWCTLAGMGHGHATDFSCLMETKARLKSDELKLLNALAVQCQASGYQSCERLDPSQQQNVQSYYATRCVISDPTGTPLNLRTVPNGKVTGTISNNVSVTIIDSARDGQGRDWSYIRSDEGGMGLGWVFGRFLKCGQRPDVETVAVQEPRADAPRGESSARILQVMPTSDRSPSGEKVENAFDGNPNTKYLNFDKLNAGFVVRFSQTVKLHSLQLTTANDFVGRDPTSMTVQASNDGRSWQNIVSDLPVALPGTRKAKGHVLRVASPAAFAYYRVTFPTVKNMDHQCGRDCDSVQIADVDLQYN